MARTRAWLSRGWQALVANPVVFVVLTLAWLIVMGVGGEMHPSLPWLLIGPTMAGLYAVALTAVRTRRADANRVQDGFGRFVQTLLCGLVVTLFVAFGLAVLLIPGIILSALYLFPFLLIVERGMSFWDAMEESRKRVQQDLLGFFGFVLAAIGVNILGIACLGVGVLVSFPVTLCAVAAAYDELWPAESGAETHDPAPS